MPDETLEKQLAEAWRRSPTMPDESLTRELAEAPRLLADDHEHGATGTMRQGHLREAREAFARYDALGGAEAHQGTLYWHTDPMHPCPTCGHHLEAPDDSE